jgi:hypothetical protein
VSSVVNKGGQSCEASTATDKSGHGKATEVGRMFVGDRLTIAAFPYRSSHTGQKMPGDASTGVCLVVASQQEQAASRSSV